MSHLLASALGSLSTCFSLALYLASRHSGLITDVTNWFAQRNTFNALFFGVIGLQGVIFLGARRKSSLQALLVRFAGDRIASAYASAAGAAFGWAVGICAASAMHEPSKFFVPALLVAVAILLVLGTPLLGYVLARQSVTEYQGRLFKESWRVRFVGIMGFLLVAIAVAGYYLSVQT